MQRVLSYLIIRFCMTFFSFSSIRGHGSYGNVIRCKYHPNLTPYGKWNLILCRLSMASLKRHKYKALLRSPFFREGFYTPKCLLTLSPQSPES